VVLDGWPGGTAGSLRDNMLSDSTRAGCGLAQRVLMHCPRRGGTSNKVRCHYRTAFWARRHRGGAVEGTSPSQWTTHRPSRPPSLDYRRRSTRSESAPDAEKASTPGLRILCAQTRPAPGSRAPVEDAVGRHWGMSELAASSSDRCPAAFAGCGAGCTPASRKHDRAVPRASRGTASHVPGVVPSRVTAVSAGPPEAVRNGTTVAV